MAGSTTARDIPSVSDAVDAIVRDPLNRVIEEVRRLAGFRGDILDRAITYRQAQVAGLIDSKLRALTGDVTVVNQFPTVGGGGGDSPDLTAPPTPTGFSGTAGFSSIVLTWDMPSYTEGHGHAQTNVYAVKRPIPDPNPAPTFGDAALVDVTYGRTTVRALPSELNTRWHLWIKWRSIDGIESASPAGGINGLVLETGQDIEQLLDVLTGKITLSQLWTDLATPIGTLSRDMDDVAAHALSASLAAWQEAADRGAALLAEVEDRGTAISTLRSLVTVGDTQLAQLITTLSATVSTNHGLALAAVQNEALARAAGDAAEAVQRSTLAAQLHNGYTGSDINAVTSGLLYQERAARVNADAAMASDITELVADVGTNAAAVAVNASALATLAGYAAAQYSVRVQVTEGGRTVVGGFGLIGTSGAGAGPEIEFGVRADRFWIGAPSGTTGVGDVLPFVVQATDQTVNGVLIPKGVYMDAAYIKNLSALVARLGSAWIDDAMVANLSAAKITTGSLAAARIAAGSLTADKLSVSELSAIAAALGSVVINSGGSLRSGQTAYDTGTGFWLGSTGGTPMLSIGDGTRALLWNGSTLSVRGDIVATGNIQAAAATAILTAADSTVYDFASFSGSVDPPATIAPITVTLDGTEEAVIVSVTMNLVFEKVFASASIAFFEGALYAREGTTDHAGEAVYFELAATGAQTLKDRKQYTTSVALTGLASGSHTFGAKWSSGTSAGAGGFAKIDSVRTRVEIIKR